MTAADQERIVCAPCIAAFPTMLDHFLEHGCEEEEGPHTPQAVVLATVLSAAVNGAKTDNILVQPFLEDALHLMSYLGPAPRWSVVQDEHDGDRWLINGIPFVLDYGSTGEGRGDLTPVVPERTCSFCHESVGWRMYQAMAGGDVEIECLGCGDEQTIAPWWPVADGAS